MCQQDLVPNVPEEVAPAFQNPPIIVIELPHDPVRITCPYCGKGVETEVKYKIGSTSLIMCCFTMPCLVCWVPLVLSRFKDSKHSCPECKKRLGMHINF